MLAKAPAAGDRRAMLRAVFAAACCLPLVAAFAVAQDAPADTPKPAAPPAPLPVELWPQGAPGALGHEAKDRPGITVHLPPRAERDTLPCAAIVVCPGGGYQGLAMDHEGAQIAAWLQSIGIAAVVLDYRHRGKGYGHPYPLLDAQRALRVVRAHATEWGIDPAKVGVLGFSAGGHLAASVSVHHDSGAADAADPIDRQSCRPDFAVLCYPVIVFGAKCTHAGSQRNLLGADATPELVASMSCERQVDAHTPPTFLWHTHEDTVVPAQNSVRYYEALLEHDVPAELHVFERGPHGIGLARGFEASAWPELCRAWLRRRGVVAR